MAADVNIQPFKVDNKPASVKLRIVLKQPPAGVDFGLQQGHGRPFTIAGKQRSKDGDLQFEFTVTAKTSNKNDLPNFTGSFVQGPVGERFVYINIGRYAGQTDTPWSRRLKIPLRESPGTCFVRARF